MDEQYSVQNIWNNIYQNTLLSIPQQFRQLFELVNIDKENLANSSNIEVADSTSINLFPIFPLHEAVKEGNLKEVKRLLAIKGADVNQTDFFGSTPLHLAVLYEHVPIVEFLLSKNANTNAVAYGNYTYYGEYWGYTPIQIALFKTDNLTILKMLIGKCSEFQVNDLLEEFFNDFLDDIPYKSSDEIKVDLQKISLLVDNNPGYSWFPIDGEYQPFSIVLSKLLTFISDKEFYNIIEQIKISMDQKDTAHIADAYDNAKILLHIFPSDYIYTFKIGNESVDINAEGYFSVPMIQFAADCLTTYSGNIVNVNDFEGFQAVSQQFAKSSLPTITDFSQIRSDVFNDTAMSFNLIATVLPKSSLPEASDLLFQHYNSGMTIVIPSGWSGHAMTMILNKDLNIIAFANGGERYGEIPPGIITYNLGVELGPNDMYGLLNYTDRFFIEYQTFYDFRLTYNPEYSIVAGEQQFGNCAWNSQQLAEMGVIYFETISHVSDNNIAKSMATIWSNQFNDFQKTTVLDEYLEFGSLEPIALTDILLDYHQGLTTKPEADRAEKIMDYLTTDEKTWFTTFWKEHSGEFSPALVQLAKEYGYSIDKPKTKPVKTDVIKLADVISNHDQILGLEKGESKDVASEPNSKVYSIASDNHTANHSELLAQANIAFMKYESLQQQELQSVTIVNLA